MFRFLHAADLHLDSPLRGLSRHEGAPVDSLRGATREAFANLVNLAIEEKVAFVLLAGDLYDSDWPDFSTAILVSRQLGELNRAGIPVFAVLGNHDAQSPLTSALEKPRNLTLFPSKTATTAVLTDLGVAIHGQSFPQLKVVDNLAIRYPAAKQGMFNIGLLHTSLDGREGHASYAPCRLDDLRARDYQYWGLGHVHAHEVVCRDPWVVFPGCLQGRHARETGAKGCALVSVADGQVISVEHRALDVIRWQSADIDLSDVDNLAAVLDRTQRALGEIVAGAEGRTAAVRLRLLGASPVHEELQARSHWLRQAIISQAVEDHGERLWIEKLLLNTNSRLDLEALLAADGSLGGLARSIMAVEESPDAVQGFSRALSALLDKLPNEMYSSQEVLQPNDPAYLAGLIAGAKDLLIGRLLQSGGSDENPPSGSDRLRAVHRCLPGPEPGQPWAACDPRAE